ncbi:hypothetical protein B484DRAFT_404470, partial [Ochromonadaceae sp. CCMP2298]
MAAPPLALELAGVLIGSDSSDLAAQCWTAAMDEPATPKTMEKVFSLCDVVLSFLIAPTSSDFQSELQKFSNENDISPAVLKSVSHGLLIFFQEGKEVWRCGTPTIAARHLLTDLSLSLTLTLTLSLTFTLTLSISLTFTLTLSLSFSLSLTLTLSLSISLSFSLSLSLFLSPSLPLSHSLFLSPS